MHAHHLTADNPFYTQILLLCVWIYYQSRDLKFGIQILLPCLLLKEHYLDIGKWPRQKSGCAITSRRPFLEGTDTWDTPTAPQPCSFHSLLCKWNRDGRNICNHLEEEEIFLKSIPSNKQTNKKAQRGEKEIQRNYVVRETGWGGGWKEGLFST